MKPILHRLHSPDLTDMQKEFPNDVENFCLLVQAFIGPLDQIGEESFDFVVCTPSVIIYKLEQQQYLFGRHYLIVEYYDYNNIFNAIDSLCNRISGSTWHEIAEKLGRYGKWEFEDYTR